MYNCIFSLRPTSIQNIKHKWEEDLGEEISDDIWEDILRLVHSSSICARHGLIQCKIIHRVHFTKMRLSKIYDDVDPLCDRCRSAPATYIHMFWSCPSLRRFWTEIFHTMSRSVGRQFDPNVMMAIFGYSPITFSLPNHKARLVAFSTLIARRLILMKWKSADPPSHLHWIRDMLHFIKLEKIRCTLRAVRGSISKFENTWATFLALADRLQFRNIPN